MENKAYYLNLFDDSSNKGNRECKNLPLMVNCAGCVETVLTRGNFNHKGRQDYYLIYIVSGKMDLSSGDMTGKAFDGDVVIFPPNKSYGHIHPQNERLKYLWVHFTGKDVEKILNEYKIGIFPMVNKTSEQNRIKTKFQRLFDCFSQNDEFCEKDLVASLEKLFIEIARSIKNRTSLKKVLSKSLRYINDNFNAPIKMTELAKMENMSMTSFNSNFKRQIGVPPTKYIINLRMNMAKELLESSDLSIKEISFMCGYSDYHFFSKVFKDSTGASPKIYKRKYHNNEQV